MVSHIQLTNSADKSAIKKRDIRDSELRVTGREGEAMNGFRYTTGRRVKWYCNKNNVCVYSNQKEERVFSRIRCNAVHDYSNDLTRSRSRFFSIGTLSRSSRGVVERLRRPRK